MFSENSDFSVKSVSENNKYVSAKNTVPEGKSDDNNASESGGNAALQSAAELSGTDKDKKGKETVITKNSHSSDGGEIAQNLSSNSTGSLDGGEIAQNLSSNSTGSLDGGEIAQNSQAKNNAETSESGYSEKETEEFCSSYPSENLKSLLQDELFQAFCEGKADTVSLKMRYEQYRQFVEDFEKRSAYRLAAKRAAVGSLCNPETEAEYRFSKEQVMAMSPAEISRYYEAIRKSQSSW